MRAGDAAMPAGGLIVRTLKSCTPDSRHAATSVKEGPLIASAGEPVGDSLVAPHAAQRCTSRVALGQVISYLQLAAAAARLPGRRGHGSSRAKLKTYD